jgi:CheY-like chemotaxis protein
MEQILKAALRARDLVKQILTFSRQTAIKRAPLEILPMLEETLKFLRASLPSTIEFRQRFSDSAMRVVADETQMSQIIMNLCTNAAQAMNETGGTLDLRVTKQTLHEIEASHHHGIQPGHYVQISVNDTGIGIPEKIIGRIFDPFFTTKERGEGTGMGLAVVHGIIQDMGGTISVYSEQGKGTTFNILLPLYEGERGQETFQETALKTGTGRILYVEDEQSILESNERVLEYLGYRVVSTLSPLRALELFAEARDSFDVVLTDYTMPGMTGLEFAASVHEIRPDIPIILCTGIATEELTPDLLKQSGVREMLLKPTMSVDLSEALHRVLHGAILSRDS